jgi:hypothetical protein
VEKNYRRAIQGSERHILPLLLDLTNPSGGYGWANHERASLEKRGPADLALVLALVHHLAITHNVPLARVADYLARLARAIVIAFVPISDSVQRLLASRGTFDDYTRTVSSGRSPIGSDQAGHTGGDHANHLRQ